MGAYEEESTGRYASEYSGFEEEGAEVGVIGEEDSEGGEMNQRQKRRKFWKWVKKKKLLIVPMEFLYIHHAAYRLPLPKNLVWSDVSCAFLWGEDWMEPRLGSICDISVGGIPASRKNHRPTRFI